MIIRPYHPSLQVVQRNVCNLRTAAQFDEQNVIGGDGIHLEICRLVFLNPDTLLKDYIAVAVPARSGLIS